MTKDEKHLEALKELNEWTTVSGWAIKVSELYPEYLEDVERQVQDHTNQTTALKEIAARIGSRVGSVVGFLAPLIQILLPTFSVLVPK